MEWWKVVAKWWRRLAAFVLGLREAHDNVTSRVEGDGEAAYEYGRRFAKFVTR